MPEEAHVLSWVRTVQSEEMLHNKNMNYKIKEEWNKKKKTRGVAGLEFFPRSTEAKKKNLAQKKNKQTHNCFVH